MKISELKPLEKNPFKSRGDAQIQAIAKSIQEFERMMTIRKIVIDENNEILGGNKRYYALKKLGYKEIPDAWIEKVEGLTDEQKREFIVKDNSHWGSEWDLELLNEWGVDLADWGVDVGFDVETETELTASEDNFEIPETIETDIVQGDLFEIGEHRLLCGDSTEKESYQKLMKNQLADMVMTDPPYNVNYGNKAEMLGEYDGGLTNTSKILNDNMSDSQFYSFLFNFYSAIKIVLKKGGSFYVWHASSEVINFGKAMVDAGLLLKQQLIWVKNTIVMGRQDYQWKHEPCLYGWNPGASHYFTASRTNNTVIEDKIDLKKLKKEELLVMLTEILSEKTPTTILRADKPTANDLHPTMKPILLLAPLINNSSQINDLVLDGFLGSGSTMVASHQLSRRCFGMELDPQYCEVIVQRMLKLDKTLIIKRNGIDETDKWLSKIETT